MEYLKVWTSFRELLEPLNESERGRLFTAMLEYAETGEAPELKGNERYVWPAAKQSIDNTRDKSEQMRANRIKPEQSETNANKSNQTGTNNIKPEQNETNPNRPFDKEKDKDKDNGLKENPLKGVKEKRDRFSPPSLEEVAAYCKERGNQVDPQHFLDFYASKGWKVGNQPMKDWKAAVRTWEIRDKAPQQQKPKLLRAQDYEQREYVESEMKETLGVRDIFKMSDEEFDELWSKGAAQ